MILLIHYVHDLLLEPPMPPPIVMTDSIVNLTSNNYSLVMKCLPSKINFSYEWKKDNLLQSARDWAIGKKSAQLTIINLKPNDSGDYWCIMSNRTGEIKSLRFTVHINGKKMQLITCPANYFILIAVIVPIVSEQPNDRHVKVHRSASFRCTAHGFGVTITWSRKEHNMPKTATVTEMKLWNGVTSILNIAKVIGYYKGEYYCIAKNDGGTVMSQAAKLNVKGT